MHRISAALCLLLALGLGGCATTPSYTIDDGRTVDEALMSEILAFGEGHRALRPAIMRSAQLIERDCQRQWELPFSVFSSATLPLDQRVAWIRALGVDERLRVIAASPVSPVDIGDRVDAVGDVRQSDGVKKIHDALVDRRDAGKPFQIETVGNAGRRIVTVEPVAVCRGRVLLSPPSAARAQNYHWEFSLHPLEVARAGLDEDEALWVVLWTQGLAQEASGRMRAVSAGMQTIKLGFLVAQLAAIATPLAAANQVAGQVAGQLATRAAAEQVRGVALDALRNQAVSAAREVALSQAQKKLQETMEGMAKGQGAAVLQQVAANRGMLTGISWMAARAFDEADAWAAIRMQRLQADPAAAFSLQRKLIRDQAVRNGIIFDEPRLEAALKAAAFDGYADRAMSALEDLATEPVAPGREAMPLATSPRAARVEGQEVLARPQGGVTGTEARRPVMPLSGGTPGREPGK